MRTVTLLATAAIMALSAGAASAATTLKFVLTGDIDATWTLPASPGPGFSPGTAFTLNDVAGTLDGNPFTFTALGFFIASSGGGLDILGGFPPAFLFLGSGEQLYTGSVTAPTFRTGEFRLTGFGDLPGNGTLTISNAVPEPASWAMMIAGFGLVGAAMRRRAAPTAAA